MSRRIELVVQDIEDILRSDLVSLTEDLKHIKDSAARLLMAYNKCDLYTALSVISIDTPLTVESKLTKGEFINGITCATQINNFFENIETASYDVLGAVYNIKYADSVSSTVQRLVYENLGNDIVELANHVINAFYKSVRIRKIIIDNNVSSVQGLRGSNFNGVNLAIQSFIDFCYGASVQGNFCKDITLANTHLR